MNPLEYLFGLEFHGHKLGLDNIRALTDALGRPQDACPSAIVAGTNGKGSVCAMTAAALSAAGYRTGCYTSPHLVHLTERYEIDGVPVAEAELADVVADLQTLAARLEAQGLLGATPTFFEVATAAAFEVFRRHRVEVAVLEVGLGGRLDATNAATPRVGAITNIAFDHQQYLGHSLAAIAAEKAGIIKPGMRLVCGERHPEALDVIADACRARQATLVTTWDDVACDTTFADGRATIGVRTPAGRYGPVTLALHGRHQVANALVAVRLLEALDATGVRVRGPAIEQGLSGARWRGRLERIDLAGGRSVLLDAAHNPAGAATLAGYLREVAPQGVPMVFGAVRDKDHRGMLEQLLPCATHLVLTTPPTPRAADPEDIRRLAEAVRPGLPIVIEASPIRALDTAWTLGSHICVAGSIFLLGAVLPALRARAVP
ncbi:MAG: bifunctional folylpolyglutamate synthase/dihydrofolate synthase [Acidobacteria bacterium]|nr:bifunctional folylpolyglutamate synthase/dihydrofolate synthase [Acidobacteriota bacterium]